MSVYKNCEILVLKRLDLKSVVSGINLPKLRHADFSHNNITELTPILVREGREERGGREEREGEVEDEEGDSGEGNAERRRREDSSKLSLILCRSVYYMLRI